MNIIAEFKSSEFTIYSDSKSVLLARQNKDTSIPLCTKPLNQTNSLSKNNSLVLTWIPSHIGINEIEWIKLKKKITPDWYIQYKNCIHWSKINHYWIHTWQMAKIMAWSTNSQYIYHWWVPSAGYRSNRKKEVILSGLFICHTHITYNKGRYPNMINVQVPLTVKHILLNCDRFRQAT